MFRCAVRGAANERICGLNAVSPVLDATLRALHGETDVRVIVPALHEWLFASVLAITPNMHPIISVLSALAGEQPGLLAPAAIKFPTLHAAVAAPIGMDMGARVLQTWADVAPAG